MKSLLIILSGALLLTACWTVKPQFPKPVAQNIKFDKPPASLINLPVSVDFSAKIPEIDASLNSALTIGDGQNDCNLSYDYTVRKTAPLTISFLPTADNPVSFTTQLGVGAGASYCAVCVNLFGRRCVVPKIGASCGRGGESLRRVQVSLSSVLDINRDYTLSGKTKLNDLYFIDPCKVTFLNINISGIIESKARAKMPLGTIDQRIGSVSIRDKAQALWDKLSENITVDNGLFLKLHPEQLSKSGITGEGQTAKFTIGLQLNPEITNDTSTTTNPLPDLSPLTGANGFNISSDIKLDYDYISKKLSEAFKNNEIEVLGKKIKIRSIKTFATNNRELIIEVFFKGDVCGYVYVLGKPEYNEATREIKFTNLSYDALTSSVLANLAAWLLEPIVLRKLEEKAKIPVGSFIDQNITKLNGYLNKQYPNGITTTGKINSINIVRNNFQALPQFLFVRMNAVGELAVDVKLPGQ